jgi:hypothetical protein
MLINLIKNFSGSDLCFFKPREYLVVNFKISSLTSSTTEDKTGGIDKVILAV